MPVKTGVSYKTPTAFATPEYYGEYNTDSSGHFFFFSKMHIKISFSFFFLVSFPWITLIHYIFNIRSTLSGMILNSVV